MIWIPKNYIETTEPTEQYRSVNDSECELYIWAHTNTVNESLVETLIDDEKYKSQIEKQFGVVCTLANEFEMSHLVNVRYFDTFV